MDNVVGKRKCVHARVRLPGTDNEGKLGGGQFADSTRLPHSGTLHDREVVLVGPQFVDVPFGVDIVDHSCQ